MGQTAGSAQIATTVGRGPRRPSPPAGRPIHVGLYTDEVAARPCAAGGIIAPPTFVRLLSPGAHKATYTIPYREVLDGGSEYEYFAPIRVGDTITSTVTLVDVFEKPGRLGLLLFRINETRYVNQFGQLVATQRSTSINYPDQE